MPYSVWFDKFRAHVRSCAREREIAQAARNGANATGIGGTGDGGSANPKSRKNKALSGVRAGSAAKASEPKAPHSVRLHDDPPVDTPIQTLVVKAESMSDAATHATVKGFTVVGVLALDSDTQWAVKVVKDHDKAARWFTDKDQLPNGEFAWGACLWYSP